MHRFGCHHRAMHTHTHMRSPSIRRIAIQRLGREPFSRYQPRIFVRLGATRNARANRAADATCELRPALGLGGQWPGQRHIKGPHQKRPNDATRQPGAKTASAAGAARIGVLASQPRQKAVRKAELAAMAWFRRGSLRRGGAAGAATRPRTARRHAAICPRSRALPSTSTTKRRAWASGGASRPASPATGVRARCEWWTAGPVAFAGGGAGIGSGGPA